MSETYVHGYYPKENERLLGALLRPGGSITVIEGDHGPIRTGARHTISFGPNTPT
jgi:hypothetical protein